MDEEMMFEMSAGSLEGLPSVGEMFDLTGKVAVVSGTIGLALSVIYRLASCGAKVVFGARREVIGQMAEERLREMGLMSASISSMSAAWRAAGRSLRLRSRPTARWIL